MGKTDTLYRMEMAASRMVAEVELWGLSIDTDWLTRQGKELGSYIDNRISNAWADWMRGPGRTTSEIAPVVGEGLNYSTPQTIIEDLRTIFNSPKRLSYMLYGKQGGNQIIWPKYFKPSKYKTGDEYLEFIATQTNLSTGVLAGAIQNIREQSKLKSVYVDGILERLIGGRLYPGIQIAAARTGRTSSSNPNIQNIPKSMRYMVIPTFDLLMGVDLSQIELRVAAYVSQDPDMLEAFMSGVDFHAKTASKMFRVKPEDVTDEQRKVAKVLNFAVLYQAGPDKIGAMLKVDIVQARSWISDYFRSFPRLKEWINDAQFEILEMGFIESPLGRVRRLSGADNRTSEGRKLLREGVNAVIQGMASDIAVMYAYLVWTEIKKRELMSRLTPALVHDFFLLDVPRPEEVACIEIVMKSLNNLPRLILAKFGINFNIPLAADIKIGTRWDAKNSSKIVISTIDKPRQV